MCDTSADEAFSHSARISAEIMRIAWLELFGLKKRTDCYWNVETLEGCDPC